jgi:dynein heavy chain
LYDELPTVSFTQIRELWQQLTDEADQVDFSLEDTKKLFSETTRKQVGGVQVC